MTAPAGDVLACRHHPSRGGRCPGCALLDRPYPDQLAAKTARLRRALDRYPHLGLPATEPIVPAVRTAAYRHRLKLPVAVGREHVAVGLYGPDHHILDTPDCPVLAEPLRAALAGVVRWLRGKEGVHSVDLRASGLDGRAMLVLACKGGDLPGGPRAARQLLAEVPALASVAVSVADREGKRVMGSAPRVVAGEAFLDEAIGPTRYRLHPGAFFQVDPLQAERIHALVREHVGDAATVLDLYAGVGAYGLALAPGRKKVLLVEEVPQAAEAARQVAPPNVEVRATRVEDVALEGRWDAAILNPARRGADPATLAALARLTGRAVYVSCGPETLARDLDVLAAHGLRAARITPVDLFPQTPEVETVVALERRTPLRGWTAPSGAPARGPWLGEEPSGATGRARVALALVIGETRDAGALEAGRYERLERVATHSLVRLTLEGPLHRALRQLAAWGHPVAGEDPRTRAFFAEKAGLLRPFVHVLRGDRPGEVPLHGDLAEALDALRAAPPSPRGGARPARGRGRPRGRRR